MILEFDKGTLVISQMPFSQTPPKGFKWDDRTHQFRDPAYLYRRLRHEVLPSNPHIADHVYESPNTWPRTSSGWRNLDLYPYQQMACDAWEDTGRKGIIVLPTGGGKTRVAAEIIRRIKTSTLILVPTRALLQQWQATLMEFSNSEIGIVGDGSCSICAITICTYESAYRRMTNLGNQFELLVLDEVHHFGCGLRDEILVMSASTMRLGLTASLPSEEKHYAKLTALVGPLIFERGIDDLSGKYLSDFDHYKIPVRLTDQELLEYQSSYGVYQQFARDTKWCWQELGWQAFAAYASQSERGRKALAAARRARSLVSLCSQKMALLEKLMATHWHQRIFVFVANTQDACEIARKLLAYPITAAVSKAEREVVLAKFRDGAIRALVACKVLNEGLDVPTADVAIILGGSGNPREQIQRVGRVLRKCPDKRAIIYEILADKTFDMTKSRRRNQVRGLHS